MMGEKERKNKERKMVKFEDMREMQRK